MKKLGSILALAASVLAVGVGSVEAAGYPPGASTTVPAGALPATGSDDAPIALVAAGLVAVGSGIVLAGVRRRKAAA